MARKRSSSRTASASKATSSSDTFWRNIVAAVESAKVKYPKKAPFHPDKKYPEYAGTEVDQSNKVYAQVRDVFHKLGLDKKNFGKKSWNPLGEIVKPGETVCIKPNFVMHYNWGRDSVFAVITHASVIRAVAEFVLIALKGKGRIIIGDAAQADCDFSKLTKVTGMDVLIPYLSSRAGNVTVEYIDFRKKIDIIHEGVCIREKIINADPRGYAKINIGRESLLVDKEHKLLYGSDYNREKTIRHHTGKKHEYVVSKSVLASDVIISLPKLKMHKKAGVTLNLKNMIGINGDKNFIPHYSVGDKRNGGDEFPVTGSKADRARYKFTRSVLDLFMGKWGKVFTLPISYGVKAYKRVKMGKRKVKSRHGGFSIADLFWQSWLKKPFRAGNWHGNDTVWRCTLDLNRILMYADKKGTRLHNSLQRKFFSLVDGIVAGEGDGPLGPDERHLGVLVAGYNPVSVDNACAQLMGFDTKNIPTIRNAYELEGEKELVRGKRTTNADRSVKMAGVRQYLGLLPSKGWQSMHRSAK